MIEILLALILFVLVFGAAAMRTAFGYVLVGVLVLWAIRLGIAVAPRVLSGVLWLLLLPAQCLSDGLVALDRAVRQRWQGTR